MDIAVDLVESYLRLNGYLTLSEFEIQKRSKDGTWDTITDVDIVAVRLPGPVYAADAHSDSDARFLLIDDEALDLADDCVDVIVGEVKQGEAVFNPGLTRHAVLHTVLNRFAWLYPDGVEDVVRDLQDNDISLVMSPTGGKVRTRLVAFGRSDVVDTHTVSLSHIFRVLTDHLETYKDVVRSAQFKSPATALLHLLSKTGFDVYKTQLCRRCLPTGIAAFSHQGRPIGHEREGGPSISRAELLDVVSGAFVEYLEASLAVQMVVNIASYVSKV